MSVDQPDYLVGAAVGGANFGTFNLSMPAGSGLAQTPVLPLLAVTSMWLQINQPTANPVIYQVNFFADPGGLSPVAPTMEFGKNLVQFTEFVIPALGSYFQVSASQVAGPAQTIQVTACGWTGIDPQTTVKVNSNYTPIMAVLVTLPASGNAFFYPTDAMLLGSSCSPGKLIGTVTSTQAGNLTLNCWSLQLNNWFAVAGLQVPAGQATPFDFNTPLSDWRLNMANGGAVAGSVNIGVCFEG